MDDVARRQTISIGDVGKVLGISRTTAYVLAKADKLPVPVIRMGKRMVVSRFALDALLTANKSDHGEEE